jgi:hypothetical protein
MRELKEELEVWLAFYPFPPLTCGTPIPYGKIHTLWLGTPNLRGNAHTIRFMHELKGELEVVWVYLHANGIKQGCMRRKYP